MNARSGFTAFETNSIDQPTPSHVSVTRKQGRSTTGCSNCKRRKVKCDERKPTCSRCNDRRLKCPGYPTNILKWSVKHEVHKPYTLRQTPTPSYSTITSEPDIEEVTRPNKSLNEYDNPSNSVIQRNHRYTGPADLYGPLSPIFDQTESLYADSCQTTFARLHSVSSDAGSTAAFTATDSLFAAFGTPFETEEYLTSVVSVRRVNDQDHADDYSVDSVDDLYHDLVDGSITDTYRRNTSAQETMNTENSTASIVSRSRTARSNSSNTLLSPTILHIPTVLVEYYFRNVCRECSTYDSSYNPFRSTVAEMQFNSAPINYAIQSLAASKLADDMPLMRVAGIEAQGKALEHLKSESMAANGLQNVSEEVLCTILLLGMTTSWHVREDLGVEYLILARRIIMAKSQAHEMIAKSNLEFYQNALKYWTMIVSIVSDRVGEFNECDENLPSIIGTFPSSPSKELRKIMPHPWTGISPAPQQLFGQVLRLIRKTRGESKRKQSSGYSRAAIACMFNAITAAESLEALCWSLPIPSVDDIKDTEDTSTPPVHHVLTAKAYLLAALLHIYMMFPDVLESRIQHESVSENVTSVLEIERQDVNMAHIVSAVTVWPQRSNGDPQKFWLRDLGLRIVECLEGIDVKSGTRVVHPPLLLSVASVLILVGSEKRMSNTENIERMDSPQTFEQPGTSASEQHRSTEDMDKRIRQCRAFIINRLETMHALMRFHAIDNILRVVKEVWRRADAGSNDVFWMDVMHELRCESLFG